VERYANDLFRLAVSLVGNAADAEDVVQETFSGAFRRIFAFRGEATVKTWLIRILVKQAARHQRRKRVRRTVSIDEAAPEYDPAGEKLAVSEDSANADIRMDLAGALETLPDLHREVIVLREIEGLTYEEMASVLSVPRGTIESRLHRARRMLRKRLSEYFS
jgi:RNA polymerase sigma-70 factor (ECF subfamily)